MTDLELDLRQNATRQFIYAELLDLLDEDSRTRHLAHLEQAGIPDHHHHDLAAVRKTIDALQVSDRVKDDARAIYQILAEAEAQVHGCAIDKTHFHEVGKGSAIRNTIGICLALEAIDPTCIIATPIQTGKGTVHCAHGVLDIPAPATKAIIARGIPVCEEKLEGERCTPTSAAIILHFVQEYRS